MDTPKITQCRHNNDDAKVGRKWNATAIKPATKLRVDHFVAGKAVVANDVTPKRTCGSVRSTGTSTTCASNYSNVANSSRFRERYLHSLGITKKPTAAKGGVAASAKQQKMTTTTLSSPYSSNRRTRSDATFLVEPLKNNRSSGEGGETNDDGKCDASQSSNAQNCGASSLASLSSTQSWMSNGSSSSKANKAKVTFDKDVYVVPIPKHEAYSSRIKSTLWMSPREMMEGVYRNTLEFTSEGWDWRSVAEDRHMYRNAQTGEMIHPVHFHNQTINHQVLLSSRHKAMGGKRMTRSSSSAKDSFVQHSRRRVTVEWSSEW